MKRLLLLVVLLGAFPAPAQAADRTITFDDPNDAPPALSGGQDEDVRSVAVAYTDEGRLTVTVSFYSSLNGSKHSDLSISASVAAARSGVIDSYCDTLGDESARAYFSLKSGYTSLTIKGYTGSLSGAVSRSADGSSVAVTLSHPGLAGKNFRCAEVGDLYTSFYEYSFCRFAGCPMKAHTVDSLGYANWFSGFAPACDDGVDNDRDGRIDLADPTCADSRTGETEGPPKSAAPPAPPQQEPDYPPALGAFHAQVSGRAAARKLVVELHMCVYPGGRYTVVLAQYAGPTIGARVRTFRKPIHQREGCLTESGLWN